MRKTYRIGLGSTPVPPKLALVADHIVEVDLTRPDGPAKIIEALAVMGERLESPLVVVSDDDGS